MIDDAQDLLAELVDYLRFCGFDAHGDTSVAGLRRRLAQEPWQVLVLDLGLPDGDGLAVARALRAEHGLALGIVIMTARGHVEDRIAGLTAGADAYLTKPVAPRELKAVVDALLARVSTSAASVQASSPVRPSVLWRLDPVTLQLLGPASGGVVLTGAEARLLAMLFEARGEVMDREQLCQRLGHGKHIVDTRRLDSLVSRLRSKVEQQCGVPLPLQTFRNLGYAFSGAVATGHQSAISLTV